MTASTFDPIATAARRMLATLGLLLCGCRPGLPPEPAGQDAADDRMRTPKYQPRPNPYETSAFDGVRLDGAGGHEGMNHGGKPMDMPMDKHRGMDMPADKPVPEDQHKGMKMPADERKAVGPSEVQK